MKEMHPISTKILDRIWRKQISSIVSEIVSDLGLSATFHDDRINIKGALIFKDGRINVWKCAWNPKNYDEWERDFISAMEMVL